MSKFFTPIINHPVCTDNSACENLFFAFEINEIKTEIESANLSFKQSANVTILDKFEIDDFFICIFCDV
jgi:hypothetical protein